MVQYCDTEHHPPSLAPTLLKLCKAVKMACIFLTSNLPISLQYSFTRGSLVVIILAFSLPNNTCQMLPNHLASHSLRSVMMHKDCGQNLFLGIQEYRNKVLQSRSEAMAWL